MSKKGLLGPLGAPQVIAIALGFILAQTLQTVASHLVNGLLDPLLGKLNMRGEGGFGLSLGAIASNLVIASLAIAGVLLLAKWLGDKPEA